MTNSLKITNQTDTGKMEKYKQKIIVVNNAKASKWNLNEKEI